MITAWDLAPLTERAARFEQYVENYNGLVNAGVYRRALGFRTSATRALTEDEFAKIFSAIEDLRSLAGRMNNAELQYAITLSSYLLSGGRIAVNDMMVGGKIFVPLPQERLMITGTATLRNAFPSEVAFGLVHESFHFRRSWQHQGNWSDECAADAYAQAATGWTTMRTRDCP